MCESGGTLEQFNDTLKQNYAIFLENTCPYLNNNACKDENNCKTKIGCGKNVRIDSKYDNIKDKRIGNLIKKPNNLHNQKGFGLNTIIFLTLMILFTLISVFQLFQKKRFNKYILTGTILCCIISTILFSLFVTHII